LVQIQVVLPMSKQKEALIYAYNKGYRIDKAGVVTSFTGKKLTPSKGANGYFLCSVFTGETIQPIPFHRLQAYTKFGNAMFESGVEVRHLDGNRTNNCWDNIAIGTHVENMLDIPYDQRVLNTAKGIPSRLKTLEEAYKLPEETIENILKYHKEGISERRLAAKFKLSRTKIRKVLGK